MPSKALVLLKKESNKLFTGLKGAFKVPFFSSQHPIIPRWVTQIKDLSRRWDTASAGTPCSSPSTSRAQTHTHHTHNVHVAFKRLDEGPNRPLCSINANTSIYNTQPNVSKFEFREVFPDRGSLDWVTVVAQPIYLLCRRVKRHSSGPAFHFST